MWSEKGLPCEAARRRSLAQPIYERCNGVVVLHSHSNVGEGGMEENVNRQRRTLNSIDSGEKRGVGQLNISDA